MRFSIRQMMAVAVFSGYCSVLYGAVDFNSNFLMDDQGIFPWHWQVNPGTGEYEQFEVVPNRSWENLWLDNSNRIYFRVAASSSRPVHFYNIANLATGPGDEINFIMPLIDFKGKIAVSLYLYGKQRQLGAVLAPELTSNGAEYLIYRQKITIPKNLSDTVDSARVVILIYPKTEVTIESLSVQGGRVDAFSEE